MTATNQPTVDIRRRDYSPGCLVSGLWFIFFGWWIGGLATLFAWLMNITILGLPIGLFILNNLPFLLILQPPGSETIIQTKPDGTPAAVQERSIRQRNWFLRALFFIFIGWWWSFIWMLLSYVVCLTIIGLPLGLVMFRLAPAMTTLRKY